MLYIEFGWPIAIPFAGFLVGWFAFKYRRPMTKVWASGIATLLSLPLGQSIVEMVELPRSWYPNYGDHSPGAGIVFLPLIAGWLLCVVIWIAATGVMAAKHYRPKHSN